MVNISKSYAAFKRPQTEQNISHLCAVYKKQIKIVRDTESEKIYSIQHYPKLAYIH